ncbi:MAG: DUF5665 domain-containing protein [Clostridia bacterium]|nr:DUF5665 domain-containing protein [Clostridia bacterium]
MKDELIDRLEQLAGRFERMRLEEYLRFIMDKKRFMAVSFLSGVMRGLGSAVGFSLLGAVMIVILQHIVEINIPLIGDFLAEVVKIVQNRIE